MGLEVCSMAFFYNTIFTSTHLGSTSKSAKTLTQESTGIVHLIPTHTSPKEQAVAVPSQAPQPFAYASFPQNWKVQQSRTAHIGHHTAHTQSAVNAQ